MKNLLFIFILLTVSVSATAQDLHTLDKELPCVNKKYSLYIHVALDSLRETNWTVNEMQGAVNSTNRYFDPICVSFEICEIDTIHNWSWDSLSRDYRVDEINDLYHQPNRINIYVVSLFDDPNICGFAALGAAGSPGGANIYLRKAGCLGSLTHEMGHLFGLPHTFGGSEAELVDGSNCLTAGDLICDTPADPYVENSDTTWLGQFNEFIFDGQDSNGQYFQPDVGNIMSYYSADCGFTNEQYIIMANTFLDSGRTMW